MVRPSSMALRTFIRASSSTALPDVRAVMESPSRMGTPDVIRVPRSGTIQRKQISTSTSLVSHPALAGLASKWAGDFFGRRCSEVGVAAATVVLGCCVMRSPPRP